MVGGTWECPATGGREAELKVGRMLSPTASASYASSAAPSMVSMLPSFEDSIHSSILLQTSLSIFRHEKFVAMDLQIS